MILHFMSFSPHEFRVLFKIETVFVSMSVSVVCLRRPVKTRNQKVNYNSFIKTPSIREVTFLSVGIFNFPMSGSLIIKTK